MSVLEAALQFEAVKIAMMHDKSGHVLKLSVHPNDTPDAIMRAPVGTRYQVVMVQLDDQNQPVAPEDVIEGKRAIKRAAMLCQDRGFQEWMSRHGHCRDLTEEACADGLRNLLGVESRAMLAVDHAARERLNETIERFRDEVGW